MAQADGELLCRLTIFSAFVYTRSPAGSKTVAALSAPKTRPSNTFKQSAIVNMGSRLKGFAAFVRNRVCYPKPLPGGVSVP